MRTAVLIFAGVVGASAAIAYLLLPRSDEVVLSAWTEEVVSRRDLPEIVEASGIVITKYERDLTSPERGTAGKVAVAEGDRVRAGQILLEVESSELADELADERARLGKAEREMERDRVETDYQARKAELRMERLRADLNEAKAEEGRKRSLSAIGAVATGELEDAHRATEAARLAVEAERVDAEQSTALAAIRASSLAAERAEAAERVARLEQRIESLSIRSPVDGSVVKVSIREGAGVELRVTLFTIADTEHPSVELRAPESQAGRVRHGQEVSLTVATVHLTGRVQSVGSRAEGGSDTQTATVAVDVALDEAPAGLIAGSSVSAEILTGVRQAVLTLPRGPWIGSGEARVIFRIEGERLARRVPVSLGATRGTEVEVLAGLEEGDRVIVSSYQEYRDRKTVGLDKKGESR